MPQDNHESVASLVNYKFFHWNFFWPEFLCDWNSNYILIYECLKWWRLPTFRSFLWSHIIDIHVDLLSCTFIGMSIAVNAAYSSYRRRCVVTCSMAAGSRRLYLPEWAWAVHLPGSSDLNEASTAADVLQMATHLPDTRSSFCRY